MNIREHYGNYIKTDHLKGGPLKLTIASVQLEEVGGDEKPVVFFTDHDKGLTLNRGNMEILADAFGDETNAWEGKQIELHLDPNVKFQGKRVGGVAIRMPQ